MRPWLRNAVLVTSVFVVASCSGGSGCSSCGGMQALPEGFPHDEIVENGASVRVTQSGMEFISSQLPSILGQQLGGGDAGLLTFDIPQTPINQNLNVVACVSATVSGNVCTNGPQPNANPPQCVADIELGKATFNLSAVKPDYIALSGSIPVRLQSLPVQLSVSVNPCIGSISLISLGVNVGLGTGGCNGPNPTANYADVPVSVQIPLIAETIAPRQGYTKVDLAHANINIGLTANDVAACASCPTLIEPICNDITNGIAGAVFNSLLSGIQGQLAGALSGQLCTKPNLAVDPPCPFGSEPNTPDAAAATVCNYTNYQPTTCMPIMLGLDGHMNLGSLLSSFSPGTSAPNDILFAAGGNLHATTSPADFAQDASTPPPPVDAGSDAATATDAASSDASSPSDAGVGDSSVHLPDATARDGAGLGITLGLLGGLAASPNSPCVPTFRNIPPTHIPIPDELLQDTQSPWPATDPNGPDIGIALAGRFLDYAGAGAYNSGLLCLGITTAQIAQLSSGLLSLIIPSLQDLTLDGLSQKSAALAVVTRPQNPPTFAIGGGTDIAKDPLLTVKMKQFDVDFYVWIDDRFVRAFTYGGDLSVPINIETGKGAAPNANGSILPVIGSIGIANGTVTNNTLLVETNGSIASGISGLLTGVLGSALGGAFSPISISSLLSSYGIALTIPNNGIRKLTKGTDDYLAIFADIGAPTAALAPVHTAAKISGIELHPEAMRLYGADRSKFPTMSVEFSSSGAKPGDTLEYSYWIDNGSRSQWSTNPVAPVRSDMLFLQGKHTLSVTSRVVGHPESEDEAPAAVPFTIDVLPPTVKLKTSPDSFEVSAWDFVSDETTLEARYSTVGAAGHATFSAWHPLSGLSRVALHGAELASVEVRDEAGNVGVATPALIRGGTGGGSSGSACGCSTPGANGVASSTVASFGMLLLVALVAARRNRKRSHVEAAITGCALTLSAGSIEGCACGKAITTSNLTGCGPDCLEPCGPTLTPGVIGSYTSIAAAKDGTLWVAGYSDSNGDISNDVQYGDLVVGTYDNGKQAVAWQIVDGLPQPGPDGSCPPNDPKGWRGGQIDTGPDVGLWTSIQVGADGHPMVSYYDITNSALKFAYFDGKTWQSYTLDQAAQSDVGRYGKMLMVNGAPVIAYLSMAPGDGGSTKSAVRVATATTSPPTSAAAWKIADAITADGEPCRAAFCAPGLTCIKETGICQPKVANGCDAGCAAGSITTAAQACVSISGKPTCGTVIGSTYIDTYPDGYGDYISLASGPKGLGIALYDRVHGTLMGLRESGGQWSASVIDGESSDGGAPTTGDDGVGTSLYVDPTSGDWHVSYVNGTSEALQYAYVPAKGGATIREVVDTGVRVGGTQFTDGVHIVGDDSSISVDSGGTVTIVYQDATAGTLRKAVGSPNSDGTHSWTVSVVAQPGLFGGFFSHQVPGGKGIQNWWRRTITDDAGLSMMLGDVSIVQP